MAKVNLRLEITGVLLINLYQIHFRYHEPVEATVNLTAKTEEEAIEKLTTEMEQHGTNLEVFGVQHLGIYNNPNTPEGTPIAEEKELQLPSNVLEFPTHPTKQ